jgi:hypothetical protein
VPPGVGLFEGPARRAYARRIRRVRTASLSSPAAVYSSYLAPRAQAYWYPAPGQEYSSFAYTAGLHALEHVFSSLAWSSASARYSDALGPHTSFAYAKSLSPVCAVQALGGAVRAGAGARSFSAVEGPYEGAAGARSASPVLAQLAPARAAAAGGCYTAHFYAVVSTEWAAVAPPGQPPGRVQPSAYAGFGYVKPYARQTAAEDVAAWAQYRRSVSVLAACPASRTGPYPVQRSASAREHADAASQFSYAKGSVKATQASCTEEAYASFSYSRSASPLLQHAAAAAVPKRAEARPGALAAEAPYSAVYWSRQ